MECPTRLELSELDQIMPRVYVRWLLCFPLSQESPQKHEIIDKLQKGITATLAMLPAFHGHIIPKISDSSRLEVKIFPEDISHSFELHVRHYDADGDETLPKFEDLRTRKYLMSELPDSLLNPGDSESLPVFEAMATFIRGGLLLLLKCHHSVVDGGGMGVFTRFLAKNCYNQPGDVLKLDPPSVDRNILPTGIRRPYFTTNGFMVVEASDKSTGREKEYSTMNSGTFQFSADALKSLKEKCTPETGFVTSHDALTALLYGTVSYARSIRISKSSSGRLTLPSILGIAVDGRKRLSPPLLDFTGNVTLYATFSNPITIPADVIPEASEKDTDYLSERLNLSSLAVQAHRAVANVTAEFIENVISSATSRENISHLQPAFSDFFQGTDFFVTSGANNDVFGQEWWPGGYVDALRIPGKGHWDGSAAVLAVKDKSAGLDVLLGLREDDFEVVTSVLSTFGAKLA